MKVNAKKIAGVGLLTALVVVLQLLGSFIKFGTVSISLVLIPIVVGAALHGVGAGAWLGGVFAVVVLCQPDTALFLNMSIFGTILTVMLKGILAGALCGLVLRVLSKKHKYAGVVCAAVVCPVVNTGIFLLGCRLFFFDWILQLQRRQCVHFYDHRLCRAEFRGRIGCECGAQSCDCAAGEY